ncbi:TIM-barrel domain-containing protein [Paenibacillus silvisoli]|uniref:TIM-barrel domain-containing protein n=1 Tax=Paenibacillus silvisoli TaxID=3110539 RepID=UPI002804D28F|nr:TIM-barrel domain-containing protein [Paenibacillus silvisoli]
MRYTLRSGALQVELEEQSHSITIRDASRGDRLLIAPHLQLFSPVLEGKQPPMELQSVSCTEQAMVLRFAGDGVRSFELAIEAREGHLELYSRFVPVRRTELNRLLLFPLGTGINMYDLVNFRNRHHTPQTWPELNCGEGFATSTYSNDWQFAPHPTMVILRKNERSLFFGAKDMPTSYGMYIEAKDFVTADWSLNYGPLGAGQLLEAGQPFESPRFCLFLEERKPVHEVIGAYTSLLVREGHIPDPSLKKREAWHTENVYCTWHDQGYKSEVFIPTQLQEQTVSGTLDTAASFMDERLVREALDVIEREKLPFRTILLDTGWQTVTGDWRPHPERFPDFRKLVDEIHSRGMKAVVWWNWAELYDQVVVEERFLMDGGKRNKHGSRLRDYSNPQVRAEYLEPLFYKLFSSDPGSYDLDGVKTDFLADKVHADIRLAEPAWRGEENYFYRVFESFYTLMKRYKPDACHIGCSGHPYLSAFIDINRTYDIFSSNVLEHKGRGEMLRSTTPGCPVAFDFHCYAEHLPDYFNLAAEHGFSVQIGNILGMKRDFFSDWEPADTAYYDMLRDGLHKLAGGN